MRYSLLILTIISLIFKAEAQINLPFQNSELALDTRVEDLMKRLSIDEKISLLLYNSPAIEHLGIEEYNWWNESLHGVGRAGLATVFPQSIGIAATFDTNLVYRMATAISDEARAKHNAFRKRDNYMQYSGLTFWSPNVNIFRDPRWGRGQETYGEDPLLSGMLGRNYVRGMQGNDEHYLKTAACAKHFAVHSGPEASRHSFNALPSDYDLYETYLPAFKMLVEADVEAVMCAYNQMNSHPCCGNTFLLQEVLRKQWGFQGHVVSDCWAVSDYVKFQNYSESEAEAAAVSILAGTNLNCGSSYKQLNDALEQKLITEDDIEKALVPVLRTRLKLGMFDQNGNNPYDQIPLEVVNCQKHVDLAYEVACKSVVLLLNKEGKDKKQCLPLNKKELKKIFVTGPLAADNMALLGNYNGLSRNLVTPLEGIVDRAGADVIVDYTLGTQLAKSEKYNGIWQASGADAVIVFLGNNRLLEGEDGDAMLNDHGGDRKTIELPANQVELVRKMRKAIPDKKLIVVLSGGSAIACPEVAELADAILFSWYPGEQGGNAIADIIFGKVNPSGKLPVTFYKSTSDLPPFDDYSMKFRTYRYLDGETLFPFGHGLSYSQFVYNEIITEYDKEKDEVIVRGRIKNQSEIEGSDLIQLYVKYDDPKMKDLNRKLIAFERIHLKAHETKAFEIHIPAERLYLYNTKAKNYKKVNSRTLVQLGINAEDIVQISELKW